MEWAARRHYPYVMLATEKNATKAAFEYYTEVAREEGYQAESQHFGYLLKAHVDETDEKAYEVGKNFVRGANNPFNEGNEGRVRGFVQNPPGMIDRARLLPTVGADTATGPRVSAGRQVITAENDTAAQRRAARRARSYDELVAADAIIVGSPKTVIARVKEIMNFLRVGSIFFWGGEGAMTHEESMRNIKLMGEEVIPALKDYAKEIGINDPFEVDPGWKSHRFLQPRVAELAARS
jgi:alkanesulfonate monooxygenase SsuD/methylene tetrahydromethanopterin reductase-like flavin-dependent oxidoreductase (luciferase family)